MKIIVDPGHGGEPGNGDPGAVYQGIQEDDLNLAIGLELRRNLEIVGAEVLMTRIDNQFIPLQKRIEFEHQERPDAFISIHCNASLNPTAGGFEMWCWKVSIGAHKLAKWITQRLAEIPAIKNRGVYESDGDPKTWQRRLVVLADTWCPSVLIECAYLSNAGDLDFLNKIENQKLIAEKICAGILDWWREKEDEKRWP